MIIDIDSIDHSTGLFIRRDTVVKVLMYFAANGATKEEIADLIRAFEELT